MSCNWFALSTDVDLETLLRIATNDRRSILTTFQAVLYVVEGVEIKFEVRFSALVF